LSIVYLLLLTIVNNKIYNKCCRKKCNYCWCSTFICNRSYNCIQLRQYIIFCICSK